MVESENVGGRDRVDRADSAISAETDLSQQVETKKNGSSWLNAWRNFHDPLSKA